LLTCASCSYIDAAANDNQPQPQPQPQQAEQVVQALPLLVQILASIRAQTLALSTKEGPTLLLLLPPPLHSHTQ